MALLEAKPALITIHARTRKEMSLVPARWQHVQRAVEIRDEIQKDILKEEQTIGAERVNLNYVL
jgi:tRNA-dihydrouridine synthase